MDTLDVKILRELSKGSNESWERLLPSDLGSLRQVATRLNVDKETVRKRIVRLEKNGAFVGWSTMLNPKLLSLKASRVWAESSDEGSKQTILETLQESNMVRTITDYFGNALSFVYVFKDRGESERNPSRVKDLMSANIRFPDTSMILSKADLRIYESIRDNFDKKNDVIAKETGISSRTVKRRLGRMVQEKAILLLAHGDPGRVEGVSADLLIRFGRGKDEFFLKTIEDVSAELEDCLVRVEIHEENTVLLSLVCYNVTRACESRDIALSFERVTEAHLYLITRIIRVREKLRLLHQRV